MKAIVDFISNHQTECIAFGGLIVSEFLALHPKLKSNSIVQLILNLFKAKIKK